GATPTAILLDPLAWAALRKMKTQDGAHTTLLGAGTTDAQKLLLVLLVTVSAALTANTGLIIDSTAIVSAVGPVNIAVDVSVYFTSHSVATRATFRIGWNLVRPERIGTFTIGTNDDDSDTGDSE